jgi:cell shape-determining protein MreD
MNRLASIFFYGLAYLVVFCEAASTLPRHLLGAQINFLPGLIVYAALTFDVVGLVFASLVLGLMFDSLSANSLGVTSFAFLVTGFAVFWRRELILRDQLFAQLTLGAMASLAVPSLSIILLFGVRQSPMIGWSTLWQLGIMTAGGALATPAWFKLFAALDRALRYKEVAEVTFRNDRQIARGRH